MQTLAYSLNSIHLSINLLVQELQVNMCHKAISCWHLLLAFPSSRSKLDIHESIIVIMLLMYMPYTCMKKIWHVIITRILFYVAVYFKLWLRLINYLAWTNDLKTSKYYLIATIVSSCNTRNRSILIACLNQINVYKILKFIWL